MARECALRAVLLFAAVQRGVAFGVSGAAHAAGCASYNGQECAACTNHQNVDGLRVESCLYRPGTHECLDAAASSSAALLDTYGRKINLLAHGHCDNLCAENTCGEHSNCVYNAATKNVSCPCDQGYLAIENSECVKITTGGEVSSDCKDQPPAGFPAQYCTMMKGMGSCANVGQHENMLTQCPVTCGFCDARKSITCTDIAQVRVSCRRRFLDKALPSMCSAECAPVYLKWWNNCSHDNSIQKADRTTHSELTSFEQKCTTKAATLPPPLPSPHTPAHVASGPCSAFDGKTCERCTDHQDGSGSVQVCNYRPGTKQCIGANNHPLDQLGRQAYLIARDKCTDKCSEFSCPAHSTCHWDASTKKAHCPCDAGYLAIDKTQCVRVTDGGAINPECVDNPPADVADRSTYCGLEKQVGACTAKTLVDEMMSQCTKTCGFCKALPKLSCMNVARVNIACPSFKLGDIMPTNCTADCASVYLAWWQKCGKDAQVVAFDQGKAKGQLAAMATKCKAVPKTLAAGSTVGFVLRGDGGCTGRNEICSRILHAEVCSRASDRLACESLCSSDATCISYEWQESGKLCQLSTSCTDAIRVADNQGKTDNWVMYERDSTLCAWGRVHEHSSSSGWPKGATSCAGNPGDRVNYPGAIVDERGYKCTLVEAKIACEALGEACHAVTCAHGKTDACGVRASSTLSALSPGNGEDSYKELHCPIRTTGKTCAVPSTIVLGGGNVPQRSDMGTYLFLKMSDGRPAYHKAGGEYLYWLVLTHQWVIGTPLGSANSVNTASNDDVFSPDLAKIWNQYPVTQSGWRVVMIDVKGTCAATIRTTALARLGDCTHGQCGRGCCAHDDDRCAVDCQHTKYTWMPQHGGINYHCCVPKSDYGSIAAASTGAGSSN